MKKIVVILFIIIGILGLTSVVGYYNVKPNIVLNGENEIEIPIGSEYNEQGAKLTIFNKDINNGYKIIGNIDTSKVGTYKIYYKSNIKYLYNNPVISRTINVVDKDIPTISLEGNENITLYSGDVYVEEGYKAKDNYDGDITEKVKITSDVDTSKEGSYEVKYDVYDSSNNETVVVRKVTVLPKPHIDESNSDKEHEKKVSKLNRNNEEKKIVSNSNSNKTRNRFNKKKNESKINQKKYITKIPVLTFHRLVPDEIKSKYYADDEWVGSVKVFEEMMKYIHDKGYRTINTVEFYNWYIGKKEYDSKTILITFDDGFYEDYYLAYPILKKYNLKATSFIVGSNIGETTHEYLGDDESYKKNTTYYIGQDVINRLKSEYPNIELQSHTFSFHHKTSNSTPKILTVNKEELDFDAKKMLNYGFKTMAYPFGAYNSDAQEALKNNNYLVAFTFGGKTYGYATRKSDRYAINRIKINGEATLGTLKKWLNY